MARYRYDSHVCDLRLVLMQMFAVLWCIVSLVQCASASTCTGAHVAFVQNQCLLEEDTSMWDELSLDESVRFVVWNCSNTIISYFPHYPCNTTGLILREGNVTSIDDGDINYLRGLISVDFSDGKISSVHQDAFANLTSLAILDMHDNLLTSLASHIFRDLSNLVWLNLHNNRISMLPAFVFAGLHSVHIINVHHNNITAVSTGLAGFEQLTNLVVLTM